jgi:hypothetical protein
MVVPGQVNGRTVESFEGDMRFRRQTREVTGGIGTNLRIRSQKERLFVVGMPLSGISF